MSLVPAASTPERAPRASAYHARISQLSRASVRKSNGAFRDLDWEDPAHSIDASDPRFALSARDPLGGSAWYGAQSPPIRNRLGLEMLCQVLKYGIGFEAVLSAGLLEFARRLPNRAPERRYALHELIEEAQHSLMFQEFIDRNGADPRPVGALQAFIDRRVARAADSFPELFFLCVLSGELFIDAEQRARLREPGHPLLQRIMQIHVTEEARHVRFAELYLREHLPRLARAKRALLRLALPTILRDGQRMMLTPDPRLARRFAIPRSVLRACYGPGSEHRARVEAIAAPLFALLGDDAGNQRVFR